MGVYSLTLGTGTLTLGKYMIEILCAFQSVNRVNSETVRRGARVLGDGKQTARARNGALLDGLTSLGVEGGERGREGGKINVMDLMSGSGAGGFH